jgi:hypothetical protein
VVKRELAKSDIDAGVIELSRADHSYRNEQKEPVYQDEAVSRLMAYLRKPSLEPLE